MSYGPAPIPHPQPAPPFYSAAAPAPPPKPSSGETRGPPLPPPPPSHNELSELDGGQSAQYQQHPSQYAAQQQITTPVIEAGWLPEELREKSTTDLHNVLNDPSLQTALLSNAQTTHPAIPSTHRALQPLLDSNISLSTHLQSLESTLNQKRQNTQSRLLALKALEQQHRAKIEETETALQQWSPMALYQRLSASVTEQDNLLKGVEQSWLEENGIASTAEVEAFVKRVRETGKLAFLRRERKARWDEGRVGGWR